MTTTPDRDRENLADVELPQQTGQRRVERADPDGPLTDEPATRFTADEAPTPAHGIPAQGGADPQTREPASKPSSQVTRRTRTSGIWVAVVVATILLIFLLVFILQNLSSVTVAFLGFSGTLPLGVALLFAAIAGALLVALTGAARILQLRHRVRRIDGSPRT